MNLHQDTFSRSTINSSGKEIYLTAIERNDGQRAVIDMREDERFNQRQICSVCARLGIDFEEFRINS